MANQSTHRTWQPTTPCRMSVALSGGGHRASAWGLGALYGLLSMRDAEAAKPDGVPIEVTAIASVSGGSLTNGVVAQELHREASDSRRLPSTTSAPSPPTWWRRWPPRA